MDKPIKESVQQAMQKAWGDTLTTFRQLEESVSRRVKAAMERADLPQGKEEFQRQMGDLGRKLQQHSETVGQRLEENLRAALTRVRGPLNEEVSQLRRRAEELGQRLEAHLHRGGDGGAPRSGGDGDGSDSKS